YILPALCLALPVATRYPLLKLLQDCTPPKSQRRRWGTGDQQQHHQPNEQELQTPQTPLQCGPWTITATHCSLEVSAQTPEGVVITVKLRL
ncbi:E4, partial [Macaca fascicularis papillomavirus 8]